MRIALLTAVVTEEDFRPHHYKFKQLASDMGHELDLLKNGEFSIAYGNNKELIELNKEKFDIKKYDVMFNRISVRATHNGNYYVIDAFNSASIPYFNNVYSVLRAKNKFHSLASMHHARIPIPKTVIIRRIEQIKDALDYIGKPPYIIKEIFGSGGSAVLIAESRRSVYPVFDFLWGKDRNAIFTIQELIFAKSRDFRDVRAIVLKDRVVTAMERVPIEDEFRANLHQGGKAHYTELNDLEKDYCVKAAQTLNLDLAGVDFIRTENGPYFLEVNATHGFEGIQSVSLKKGIDLIYEVLKHCEKLYKLKMKN